MIKQEILRKVFAQYLGQKIRNTYNKKEQILNLSTLNKLYHSNQHSNENISYFWQYNKLILAPISKIKSSDAIDICNFLWTENSDWRVIRNKSGTVLYSEVDDVEIVFSKSGSIFYIENKKQPENFNPISLLISYQMLIGLGYDLPNYLLGGKTLIESGVAIEYDNV